MRDTSTSGFLAPAISRRYPCPPVITIIVPFPVNRCVVTHNPAENKYAKRLLDRIAALPRARFTAYAADTSSPNAAALLLIKRKPLNTVNNRVLRCQHPAAQLRELPAHHRRCGEHPCINAPGPLDWYLTGNV